MVPLLKAEPSTPSPARLRDDDPEVVVWWGTETECASAVMREERVNELSTDAAMIALERLAGMRAEWIEVDPTERVRELAGRIVRTHPLRAADAFQLAAAIVASEGGSESLGFVCLDSRLTEDARREGFPVVTPDSAR